jgi:hypothetical protein
VIGTSSHRESTLMLSHLIYSALFCGETRILWLLCDVLMLDYKPTGDLFTTLTFRDPKDTMCFGGAGPHERRNILKFFYCRFVHSYK